MARRRVVVVCPGRGTYNQAEWGYLGKHHGARAALIGGFDGYRSAHGQPSLTELDRDTPYQLALHSRGDHASALIWACAYLDALAIDRERYEVVAVTGNSMGWYIALAVAQALEAADGLHLVNTMGTLMQESLIGGQLLQPVADAQWRPQPAERAQLLALLAQLQRDGLQAHLSIDLGGALVFGADAAGLAALQQALPPRDRYPLRLHNHAAFHTPLQAPVRERARAALARLPLKRPALPLVDGRGGVWTPWSADPAALWDYTLGAQLVQPYDFARAIGVALREFAPDALVLLGPGSTLGGAVAQVLIAERWRGLADKASFQALQEREPFLLSMGWDSQRARVVAAGSEQVTGRSPAAT